MIILHWASLVRPGDQSQMRNNPKIWCVSVKTEPALHYSGGHAIFIQTKNCSLFETEINVCSVKTLFVMYIFVLKFCLN